MQLKIPVADTRRSELNSAREKTLTRYKTALRRGQESVFNIAKRANRVDNRIAGNPIDQREPVGSINSLNENGNNWIKFRNVTWQGFY